MLLRLAKNSQWLQNLVARLLGSLHPSIEHNVAKIEMLKKAFFYCELEELEGSYFEFGVYEGTSLYAAVQIYQKLSSKIERNFYGFDSFDDGFKYFNEKDKHPFFREGDFKSSYEKAMRRFKHFGKSVHLIKGYFEETVKGKDQKSICGTDICAILFIDCDLMGPASIALEFMRPLLRPGTVIVLDDYWAYKGNPDLGTCGALNQFLRAHPGILLRDYYTYGHGGKSFVVSQVAS